MTMDGPFCATVDWGTTSLRLWLLDAEGAVLAESRGDDGLQKLAGRSFADILEHHLGQAGAPAGLPVLICGMAGARQGWVEAPYVQTPAKLSQLADEAIAVIGADRDIRILPGLAQRDEAAPNVMRGEETQILGALPESGSALFCMPGTHCKWVRVQAGHVREFSTFMTGELFDLLSSQSILRHSIDRVEADEEVFFAAVDEGLEMGAKLFATLFSIRAGDLLGLGQAAGDRLSGWLIGAELDAALDIFGADRPVTLMASGRLGARYQLALPRAGFEVETVDAETAARQGLFAAARRIWGNQ